jgi:3-deoxy-manno-octulosonate cytidylyltransferase (CMP-KDO synthetase)
MRIVGIIPARWQSTRFPGKSLARLCGKPLIQWVLERSQQARRLDALLVATDDERIRQTVLDVGGRVVMTSDDHHSGTDRVAEAAVTEPADVIINIQGDEPLVDPRLIDQLASVMSEQMEWDMATAAAPLAADDVSRPSICKVVMDGRGQALYFSRAAIPFVRDASFRPAGVLYWRHIGIYAYRGSFLQRFVAEQPCELERAESLEQLRALHMGARIKVETTEEAGIGVDLPADVPLAEEALQRLGLA